MTKLVTTTDETAMERQYPAPGAKYPAPGATNASAPSRSLGRDSVVPTRVSRSDCPYP